MTDQEQQAQQARDKAIRDEIIRNSFVGEGQMVAFPLCFPGATVPIVADESHITALVMGPNHTVYGGTSGQRAHIIAGLFYRESGAVYDLGVAEDAQETVAIACAPEYWVACVNGPAGGRVVRQALRGLPSGLIQEWGSLKRQPFDELGAPVAGERIVHAVLDATGRQLVMVTEGHLATVDVESGETRLVEALPAGGQIARGNGGGIFGNEEQGDALWRYDAASGELARQAVRLPQGAWQGHALVWATDPVDGTLFTVDGEGYLFSFREGAGFSPCLGQVPLMPVGAMAVTFDGRVFGSVGTGIGKLFCYDPAAGQVKAMGVALSVIERRRYGYQFGAAITGRDGEIILGENDDLGHLWLYYPRIQRHAPVE